MFMHVIVKYFPYMSVFPNSLRRQGSFTEFCGFQNPGPCGRTTAADLFSHSHRCCPLTSVSHQRINFCAAGAMEAAQPLQLFPSLRRQKACWSSPASQDFCPWHEKKWSKFCFVLWEKMDRLQRKEGQTPDLFHPIFVQWGVEVWRDMLTWPGKGILQK